MLFLQETLLTQFNANELHHLTHINTIACFATATPSTSPKGGRPKDGLAVFWKTSDTTNFFSFMFTSRVMGLKVQALSHSFVLLNVCLCCDDASLILLFGFHQICRIFQTLLTMSPFMIYS